MTNEPKQQPEPPGLAYERGQHDENEICAQIVEGWNGDDVQFQELAKRLRNRHWNCMGKDEATIEPPDNIARLSELQKRNIPWMAQQILELESQLAAAQTKLADWQALGAPVWESRPNTQAESLSAENRYTCLYCSGSGFITVEMAKVHNENRAKERKDAFYRGYEGAREEAVAAFSGEQAAAAAFAAYNERALLRWIQQRIRAALTLPEKD